MMCVSARIIRGRARIVLRARGWKIMNAEFAEHAEKSLVFWVFCGSALKCICGCSQRRSRLMPYNPRMRTTPAVLAASLLAVASPIAQNAPAPAVTILKPARVFDGDAMHEGWAVRVKGERIDAAGPAASVAAAGAKVIDLPGTTLMPGLVEGHSHILLHAYSETSWNDQVSQRGARAARGARDQPSAGDAAWPASRPSAISAPKARGYADVELQAGGEAGHHSRPAHAGVDARDRRHRQLPAEVRARMERSAGRRGGRRRRQPDARRARSDRPRRRLDQALRRLPLGPAAGLAPDVLAGRDEAGGRDRRRAPACRSPSTRAPPKACGARRSPASRRSSTATTARRRSSS